MDTAPSPVPSFPAGTSLARRVVWRAARAFGGRPQRWAWDDQYRRGRWAGIVTERDPLTVALVERIAAGGSVIELGCGAGALAAALRPDAYSTYLGVDISEVAIEWARRRATELGLTRCNFEVGDMGRWGGAQDVALVVIEEALMYLQPHQQRSLLHSCMKSLRRDGRILVTAHSGDKHRMTLDLCRETCTVVEESGSNRVHLVLMRSGA